MSDSLVTKTAYEELIAFLDSLDVLIQQFIDDISAYAITLQEIVTTFERDQYQFIYGRGGMREELQILVANGLAAIKRLVDIYAAELNAHLNDFYITETHKPDIRNIVGNRLKITDTQLALLENGWYYQQAPFLKNSGFINTRSLKQRVNQITNDPARYTRATSLPFGVGWFNPDKMCASPDKIVLAVPFSATDLSDNDDDDGIYLADLTSGEIYMGNMTVCSLPVRNNLK